MNENVMKMPEGDELHKQEGTTTVARNVAVDHIYGNEHDSEWCLLCIDQQMIDKYKEHIEILQKTTEVQKRTIDTQKETIVILNEMISILEKGKNDE